MGHTIHATISGIEIITATSYFIIFLGFVIRWIGEGIYARLLWPPLLAVIFGLCGLTRLDVFVGNVLPDIVNSVAHVVLMFLSLGYAIGQMMYACWPELFEEETLLPTWRKYEE